MATSTNADWEALDALLGPDPNIPSLAYQVHENVPLVVPWNQSVKTLELGIGLAASVAAKSEETKHVFRPSPFVPTTADSRCQLEFTDNNYSFRQNASSHTGTSYSHMDVKGSLSIGNSFLGASGKGHFNKNVYGNTDSNKVSLQASVRLGRVIAPTSPRLSARAIALLRASPQSFHEFYGDYFLYALPVGGDTSTLLSTATSADLRNEMRDIEIKAKFLFMTKTVYSDHSRSESSSSSYDITYTGFDSMTGYAKSAHANNKPDYLKLKTEATKNVANGMALEERCFELLKGFGVEIGGVASLSKDQYAKVCSSGLVVEAMFLPYSGLRDYQAVVSARVFEPLERHL